MSPRARARRNRLWSAGVVAAALLACRIAVPDAALRAPLLYAGVVSVGWGHLVGALGRRRPLPEVAFAACSAATLLALYLEALARVPALVLLLLGAAVWHALENDRQLEAAYAGGLRLPPLSRAWAAGAGLALPAALAVSAAPGVFADLFAAAVLYHVASWARLVWDEPGAVGRRRLVAVHALPAAACAALLAAPLGWDHPARTWVFSPAVYLFWSTLHVVHTAARRGLSSRGDRAPSSRARAGPS